MPFFSPGGLSGHTPSPSSGLDPQLIQALMAQFPQLAQSEGPQTQQPNALQGYTWPGIQFSPGQGSPQSLGNLSPFEGAKGFGSESITAGLALGNYGKSSSQAPQPGGANPFSLGQLSLPTLALPQAVAAQQGGFGEGDLGAATTAPAEGGITIGAGDVLGAAEKLGGAFDLGTGTAFDPTGQTQTPAYQEQRAGERVDYSNATGSPGGIPQSLLAPPAPLSSFLQPPDLSQSTFSMGYPENFGVTPGAPTQTLAPGTTFSMLGEGPTSFAPGGGSAQDVLGAGSGGGPTTPQGDLLGGGLSTLQGLLSLYGGAQTGDPGQLLSGTAGTLGGLGQMAPAQVQALAAQLGVSPAMLGDLVGGLGALGAGYGLYQGIQQGDPLQALLSGSSLYSSGAPVVNSLFGTNLPSLSGLAAQGAEAISPGIMSLLSGVTSGAGVSGAVGAGAGLGSLAGAAAPVGSAIGTGGGMAGAGIAGTAGGAAGAGGGAAGGVLGGAVAGGAALALPAWILTQFITDSIQQSELQNMRSSGWWNNPIRGQLYSDSTAGVKGVNDLLAGLGGDLAGKDTYELGQALTSGVNSLLPYYATAQGGRGAIKASDTITGAGIGTGRKPYTEGQTPEQYTQNYQQAQQGIVGLVNELMKRGVTYEQLGQLPVSGDWSQQTLDAGGTPLDYLMGLPGEQRAKLMQEGGQLYGKFGGQSGPMASVSGADYRTNAPQSVEQQVDALLGLSLGSSMLAPGSGPESSNASGLYSNMYGGPLWAAMARMGVSDPTLQGLMQQNFDPWVTARDPAFQQQWTGQRYTPEDIANYEAQHGFGAAAQAGLAAGGLVGGPMQSAQPAAQDFWGPLGQQYAQKTDPMTQQLQQYMQQLQQVQGGLPQIAQGLQQQETAGLDPGVMQALQAQMGGAPSNGAGGGGIDLQALLRQLGLAA